VIDRIAWESQFHLFSYFETQSPRRLPGIFFSSDPEDSQASVEDILGELAERYTWYQGKHLDKGQRLTALQSYCDLGAGEWRRYIIHIKY
jgi:hypothetical protein